MAEILPLLSEVECAEGPSTARFDEGDRFISRVAVLPSAFNPPTRAHLALLSAARTLPGVESAAALLTTRNVSKGLTGAGFADRIGMLLAAREETAWLGVLATNQARIVDQEAALTDAYPGLAFDFVVGYDTLIRLFDASYYTSMERELAPFFSRTRLIALNRGEADTDAVRTFIARHASAFAQHILVAELDAYSATLSSTLARAAIDTPQERAIVTAPVEAYMAAHRLYR